MNVPLHQVDAFTSRVFGGNPAAVCPLPEWIPDATLQAIAAENNLSETAFLVGGEGRYAIRWFTPVNEVDLCGHATLAAAHVVFGADPSRAEVTFSSRSGDLRVSRDGALYDLDFPARPARAVAAPPALREALGRAPGEVLAAERDYLAVFGSEDEVRALRPDMARLATLDRPGVIVTAAGDGVDFVSRFFAPRYGIPEDPVTGSAHCTLVPYWAARLGKDELDARQVSERGGELRCRLRGDRVTIAGRAVTYLVGAIEV